VIVPEGGGATAAADSTDEMRAFEELLVGSAFDALRLARFLGRDPEDAADVVQEAAILAWRYRHTRRGAWKPWFLAIVRRVAHRSRQTWTLLPWAWRPEPASAPELFGQSEVAIALSSLPQRQRAAVWLRYGQDLTYKDVGRILGVREGAAKMLVARGRASLRAHLTSSGEREGS